MKFSVSETKGWEKAIVNNISFEMCKQHSRDIFFTSMLMHSHILEAEAFARPGVTSAIGQKFLQEGRSVGFAVLSHDWHLTEEVPKEQLQRNVLPHLITPHLPDTRRQHIKGIRKKKMQRAFQTVLAEM